MNLPTYFDCKDHRALKAAMDVLGHIKRTYPVLSDGTDAWDEANSPFGTPIIAGGAPRDLVLDRPVRDWDIWWPVPRRLVTDAAIALHTAGPGWWRFRPNNLDRGYAANGYCRPEMLAAFKTEAGVEVDVILIDKAIAETPAEVVATFDNSLSRIWLEPDWDAGAHVHWLPEFAQSVESRTIWVPAHIPTREAHLARIADKYPDFRMHIADPELAERCRCFLDGTWPTAEHILTGAPALRVV